MGSRRCASFGQSALFRDPPYHRERRLALVDFPVGLGLLDVVAEKLADYLVGLKLGRAP
jgi:hypothetical protein